MESEQLGPYCLLRRLAVGGMGEVFEARQSSDLGQRLVAIKRLRPHLAKDPDFVESFRNEARIAAVLSHPNVVQTFEIGQTDEGPYIAMEYIDGPVLVELLSQQLRLGQQLSLSFVVHIATRLAHALHYIHQRCDLNGHSLEIVHMDLAPHNILLTTNGDPKLIDFGIARARDISPVPLRALRGRTAYLAPEQFDDVDLDARRDIFALGVIMHEMLTGAPLFRDRSEQLTATRLLRARIPPPHQLRPDCPEQLSGIILKALCRDRDRRYHSAAEVLDELDRCSFAHGIVPTTAVFRGEMKSAGLSRGRASVEQRHLWGEDSTLRPTGIA